MKRFALLGFGLCLAATAWAQQVPRFVGQTHVAPPTWSATNKNANIALSSGNMIATAGGVAATDYVVLATMPITSGQKIWCEFKILVTADNGPGIGIANSSVGLADGNYLGNDPNGLGIYTTGAYENSSSVGSGFGTLAANDILDLAIDTTASTVQAYLNNVSVGTYTYSVTGSLYPAADAKLTGSIQLIASGSFTYAPPAGFTKYGL